jgi:hypothetical protein
MLERDELIKEKQNASHKVALWFAVVIPVGISAVIVGCAAHFGFVFQTQGVTTNEDVAAMLGMDSQDARFCALIRPDAGTYGGFQEVAISERSECFWSVAVKTSLIAKTGAERYG